MDCISYEDNCIRLLKRSYQKLCYKHGWGADITCLNANMIRSELLTREQRGGGGCKRAPPMCKFAPPMFFFRIFLQLVWILKCGQNISTGSNSACCDVLRVTIALSSIWSDVENQGHPPWKNRRFSAGRSNFGFQQHPDIIPRDKPTFSTTADLNMLTSTSPTLVVIDSRWRPPNRNWK